MLQLEEAVARVLSAVPPAKGELVPVKQAAARVLLERIVSPLDLPPFDNSAMDGYAVRAEDLAGARAETPVVLRIVGKAAAGQVFRGSMGRGECVRVFTGSALPRGADAVVMQEDTRSEAGGRHLVSILAAAKPWENIRFRGEDVKRGALLMDSGIKPGAGGIMLMGAIGITKVNVGRKPVVGLLATGSELRETGEELKPGQVYESNRAGLAALAASAGAIPKILRIVNDTLAATRRALRHALAECDAVVTSGGVSVGEMDFVKPAIEEVGGKLDFWRVAMRPGRPFAFGRCGGKLVFGLPGNPVSAFVTFLLLVRPALLRWQGAREVSLPAYAGRLGEAVNNDGERRHFLRVKYDAEGVVRLAGVQVSNSLRSLAGANALLDVPPRTEWAKGKAVLVSRWD